MLSAIVVLVACDLGLLALRLHPSKWRRFGHWFALFIPISCFVLGLAQYQLDMRLVSELGQRGAYAEMERAESDLISRNLTTFLLLTSATAVSLLIHGITFAKKRTLGHGASALVLFALLFFFIWIRFQAWPGRIG